MEVFKLKSEAVVSPKISNQTQFKNLQALWILTEFIFNDQETPKFCSFYKST